MRSSTLLRDCRRALLLCALLGLASLPGQVEGRETEARLSQLARAYGLRVVVADGPLRVESTHGVILAKRADNRELRIYREIFREELSRYPVEFIRKTELRRFVLCKGLSFNGQERYAIPDFEHDTIYLNLERPLGLSWDPSGAFELYRRKVFHHELYHQIDWKDDGLLYRDDAWAKLNPRSFRYGPGGINMRGASCSLLTHEIPGFVTQYATAGVEEDKAEVYANLMANNAALTELACADALVATKVEALVARLDAYSATTRELLAGAIPLTTTSLVFRQARVTRGGLLHSSPELEAARKTRRPVLLYVRRRAWRGEGEAALSQARACARLESVELSGEQALAAAEGWTLLCLDVSTPAAASFATELGAKAAPALLVWPPGAARPRPIADFASLSRESF